MVVSRTAVLAPHCTSSATPGTIYQTLENDEKVKCNLKSSPSTGRNRKLGGAPFQYLLHVFVARTIQQLLHSTLSLSLVRRPLSNFPGGSVVLDYCRVRLCAIILIWGTPGSFMILFFKRRRFFGQPCQARPVDCISPTSMYSKVLPKEAGANEPASGPLDCDHHGCVLVRREEQSALATILHCVGQRMKTGATPLACSTWPIRNFVTEAGVQSRMEVRKMQYL